MNYLAHAWLSFNQPEILTGNMISDFVKGKKRFDFTEGIQKGIMLHRSIDAFTDTHITTKQAKEFLKPEAGLYAGAFIDIVYDHFLALDKNEFTDESLFKFSRSVYATLNIYKPILPQKFSGMLPYMQRDNWLYNYRTLTGIEKSFAGLARRAKYIEDSTPVFQLFKKNYEPLEECYNSFYPAVKDFARKQLNSSGN